MEEALKDWARIVVTLVEAGAVLLVAAGAAEAVWRTAAGGVRAALGARKLVWVHFARWLLLALEFQLAADILRSAIEPTWDDIGQLAAIAAIRTFLAFFLERDMETAKHHESGTTHPAPERAPEPL